MFKNYLTIAIRNIARHKVYSFINIAGLAIGMACCALILLYVQHELSYDDFHTKGDRIYRVLRETRGGDGRVTFRAGISGPFAPALMNDFPEVENAVRLQVLPATWTRYESERVFRERRRWLLVEPDFFTMFDFTFVQGDQKRAGRIPICDVDSVDHWHGDGLPTTKLYAA